MLVAGADRRVPLLVAALLQPSARMGEADRPADQRATGGLSIWVVVAFDKSNADFQFVSMHTWIKPWGISWHLGIDGISLFLVLLTGVLFPFGSSRAPTRTTTTSDTCRGCCCSRPG